MSSFLSLAPYHLLAYSTLLGTQLWQTFVMTKLCFLYLPTPQFTSLQRRVFPVYFRSQTLLTVLLTLTCPRLALFRAGPKWSVALLPPASAALATLNMLVYGPRCIQAMGDRIHQETRDGRKHTDLANMSDEMRLCNRRFSKAHAMCIHLNLVVIGATVWYGFDLASRLSLAA